MSLSDLFNFELFNLKDIGKGLGKHPLQKLLFGIDPLGTKIGNTITGHEDEPLVDQMGGAYGGRVISFGPKGHEGGVYGRAKEAGIDTSSGAGAQDLAHLIAAYYATSGGFGGGGQTNPTGVGPFGNQPPPSPQGATPPIFGQGGSNFQNLQNLQRLQGLLGGGQQQQQSGQPPAPLSLPQSAGQSSQDIAQQQALARLKAKPYKSPADFAVLARAGLLG